MSGAFIAAIGENFETAAVTVDWFHVVQLFTRVVDEVRRAEVKRSKLPKALRWAVLKRADGRLTEAQVTALAELEASDLFTAVAWRIKEKLAGSARRNQFRPHVGGSPTSCATPANCSIRTRSSIRFAGRSRPSRPTASGSCSAGRHPTATPVSKGSMVSSRPPERVPAAIATSRRSPPSST